MESKFRYKLTQKADADLDDIVSYIAAELANPKAASDFVDKLQIAIEEAVSNYIISTIFPAVRA